MQLHRKDGFPMAKKISARSKGYRKTVQKKPFLTRKEIAILIGIVLAIVLAIVLFNVFYDDGSLEIKDGQVVAENLENSIVYNFGTGDAPKYYKLGEIGEIEGYTRQLWENSADALVRRYTYTPSDEASPIEAVTVSGALVGPEDLANSMLNYTIGSDPESEVTQQEIGGRTAYLHTYTTTSTDEEAGTMQYLQNYDAYVVGAGDRGSICVRLSTLAESPEILEGDALTAFIEENSITDEEALAQLELFLTALNTESSK